MTNNKTNHNKIKVPVVSTNGEISEIITLLNEIDTKIISLNDCSSSDFLSLNAHFKNWYKLAKELTENAGLLFTLLSGKEFRK